MTIQDFVVYGPGELGRLYAGGALRLGRRVTPITRGSDRQEVFSSMPEDVPILLSVREDALAQAVADVPKARRRDVILVQNELFPKTLRALGLEEATVAVVWLLQKKGQPRLVARPTQVFGPSAAFFRDVHESLELPAEVLADERALARALVAKYAFIFAVNLLGVLADRTVGAWLIADQKKVLAAIDEGLELGAAEADLEGPLAGERAVCLEAMQALSSMPARGRTAKERVERASRRAKELSLSLPLLEEARG